MRKQRAAKGLGSGAVVAHFAEGIANDVPRMVAVVPEGGGKALAAGLRHFCDGARIFAAPD